MMKKLLILMLVFGLASLANATVIDVVAVDVGQSGGRLGTELDKLEASDTIGLQIVLNTNPYAGYPSYDGYTLDTINVDLHVSGAATLSVPGIYASKAPNQRIDDDLLFNAGFEMTGHSGTPDDLGTAYPEFYEYTPMIVGNSIAMMQAGDMENIAGPAVLIWNLLIHCEGEGDVVVDLTLNGATHYWEYSTPSGGTYGSDYLATEEDLGDLTIYQVPEPATIALLGLGSMFLMRRRRK